MRRLALGFALGVLVGTWAETGGEVIGYLIHSRSILPN